MPAIQVSRDADAEPESPARGGVGEVPADRVDRQAERLGGHLQERGVRALADVGAGVVQLGRVGARRAVVAVEHDLGLAALGEPEREARRS